jgi:hypothetical protein
MTEQDLNAYATETGFQGGLNDYRIFEVAGDLSAFSALSLAEEQPQQITHVLLEFPRQAKTAAA